MTCLKFPSRGRGGSQTPGSPQSPGSPWHGPAGSPGGRASPECHRRATTVAWQEPALGDPSHPLGKCLLLSTSIF